jgi:hypothetical protein
MTIESSFWNLDNTIRKNKFHTSDENDVIEAAKELSTKLDKERNDDLIRNMKTHYFDQIAKIKHFMSNAGKENPVIKSLHDKIFQKHFNLSQIPQNVTRIFEVFIKGITYFHSEDKKTKKPSPIYHRISSCGNSRDNTFRGAFLQCSSDKSLNQINEIKKRIQKCYLERLIYNEIYLHESVFIPGEFDDTHSQDKGHVNWMNETKRDFHSCFPTEEITVTVDMYDGFLPRRLVIKRYHADVLLCVETYIKEIGGVVKQYLESVECYQKDALGMVKAKIQTFQNETEWEICKGDLTDCVDFYSDIPEFDIYMIGGKLNNKKRITKKNIG